MTNEDTAFTISHNNRINRSITTRTTSQVSDKDDNLDKVIVVSKI